MDDYVGDRKGREELGGNGRYVRCEQVHKGNRINSSLTRAQGKGKKSRKTPHSSPTQKAHPTRPTRLQTTQTETKLYPLHHFTATENKQFSQYHLLDQAELHLYIINKV